MRFRQALIIRQLDRRLIERTVELAQKSQKFGSRQLRAALYHFPLRLLQMINTEIQKN